MASEPYVEAEKSPNERYIRYEIKLGEGATKRVWQAFDTHEGKMVAWNCSKYVVSEEEEKKVRNEISILKNLKHDHILHLYDFWHNKEINHMCFITDMMPDGTLRDFMFKVGRINLKIIKNWCKQILSALSYMHSLSPPVIHRDLKCDNIFIESSTGTLRVGDFGLSVVKTQSFVSSMIGTPAFMAPEIFDEKYTEKIDIYAFGLCLLEMSTNMYPYEEYDGSIVKIWKAIRAGIKPKALSLVKDKQIYELINICISCEKNRPTAKQLLEMPLFDLNNSDDNVPVDLYSSEDKIEDDSNSIDSDSLPTADDLKYELIEKQAQFLEAQILANWDRKLPLSGE
jgi:WNK lysine deficient protein kinase